MLARAGIKINLLAQPKAKYFAKILVSGGYDTSFYLLGWTPGSFDSWNVLANMYRKRDEKGVGGNNNVGNYYNPKVEELTNQILVEADTAKRDQLIKPAYDIAPEPGLGLHPAAPAGAGLGRVEEGQGGAARRQPDPVLLVQKRVRHEDVRRGEPSPPAADTDARLHHPPPAAIRRRHADGVADRVHAVPLRRRPGQPDGRHRDHGRGARGAARAARPERSGAGPVRPLRRSTRRGSISEIRISSRPR